MDSITAQSLIAGQKIKYWDGRIATVANPYTPAIARSKEPREPRPGLYIIEETGGEVTIVFDDDIQEPKAEHHIKDYDLRLAEPL